MKISRLPDRLDRMPMLKILVFFAAGIALADRYELPLWFLAGAFVVTGVLALSLRSSAATAAMILTAGFAAAQFRAPRATVPRGVHTVYEVTVEGFPADRGRYAVADASVAAWRDPADGRWHASDAVSGYTPIRLRGCMPGSASAAGARCGRFAAVRKAIAA